MIIVLRRFPGAAAAAALFQPVSIPIYCFASYSSPTGNIRNYHQQQHSDDDTIILCQSDSEQHLRSSPRNCKQSTRLPLPSFQYRYNNAKCPLLLFRCPDHRPSSLRQEHKLQHRPQQQSRSIFIAPRCRHVFLSVVLNVFRTIY